MEVIPFLFIAVFVVAAILMGIAAHKARQARILELSQWAAGRGWRFEEGGPHRDFFERFPGFARGHSRRAYNTMSGGLAIGGREFGVTCGDYEYKVTSSNGKTTTTRTYRFSYVLLRIPGGGVPDLEIRSEGFFDKVTQAIGFDDIDFESEEFSRAFCVKSASKKFAYDVITAQMMEFLLAVRPEPLVIRDGSMCLSEGRGTWSTGEFEERLAFADQFFSRWPEFVFEDLGARNRGV